MESVIRGIIIFGFLLLIFRIAGNRSIGQITTFDFVLLLIISEATQNALVGKDYSMMNAFLLIITLVGMDIGLSLIKQRAPKVERWLEGLPLVLVDHGRPVRDRMSHVRVDETDILAKGRELQGLERMDQIKYAILERDGHITIIPK